VEEDEWLEVICSSQRVAGSRHQLTGRVTQLHSFNNNLFGIDAVAAYYDDDVNTGNIPAELSLLSCLD
jgi:hypothetical protein